MIWLIKMKILVYGTESFDDYSTFMRGVVVAIESNLNDNDNLINILTAGPHKINNFTAEFVNRSESLLRQKKMKIRFTRVSFKDVLSNFKSYELDYVISFNKKTDRDQLIDAMISKAEEHKVESAFYKY
jgi:hypothetical protein